MPIYHLSLKPISRSAGRTSTAAAAYRSASRIVDERTGEEFDFRRKQGVVHSEIIFPPGCNWQPERSELWNAAEAVERRRDACVAREHEAALPKEMDDAQRRYLARAYAIDLAARHGCAVDFNIHTPRRDVKEGEENHHCHFQCTTRKVGPEGLGEKCDRERAGRDRKADLRFERKRWEELCNEHLKQAGIGDQIDCRSLVDQGVLDRPAGQHWGPTAAAVNRKLTKEKQNSDLRRPARRSEDLKKNEKEEQRRAAARQAQADSRAAEASARLRRRLTQEPARVWGGEGKESRFLKLDGLHAETRAGRTVWKFSKTGIAAVVDHGDSLAVTRLSDSRVGAAIQIAHEKGWKSLVLTGSTEFKEKAVRAALEAGLSVENVELQHLVKQIEEERQRRQAKVAEQPISQPKAPPSPLQQKAREVETAAAPPLPATPAALGRRAAEVDYLLAEQAQAAERLRSMAEYAKCTNKHSQLATALQEARSRQQEGVEDDPWLREVFTVHITDKLAERRDQAKKQGKSARAHLDKLEGENMLNRLLSTKERKCLAEKIAAAKKVVQGVSEKIQKIEEACKKMQDPKTRAAYISWGIQRMKDRNQDVERLQALLAEQEAERLALERRAGLDPELARRLKDERERIAKRVETLSALDRERYERARQGKSEEATLPPVPKPKPKPASGLKAPGM